MFKSNLSTNRRKWHRQLSRRSTKPTIEFWLKRPQGALIRFLEIALYQAPLFSLLFTRNSKENLGVTLEKMVVSLGCGGVYLRESNKLHRTILSIENAKVDIVNGVAKTGNNFFFSPHHSDRSYMSGNGIDDIRRLNKARRNIPYRHGHTFCLPKQDFYFHYLIEFLPRVIDIISSCKDISLLTPGNQPRFVHESLNLANIKYVETQARIESIESFVFHDETSLYPLLHAVETLRELPLQKFKKNQLNNVRGTGKKIFISRPNQPRYSFQHEIKMMSFLEGLNFSVINPFEIPFGIQRTIFSRCTVLIGAHGGAMANMVFMPRGSAVIEIYSKGYSSYNPEFFKELAKVCGVKYFSFATDDTEQIELFLNGLLKKGIL